MTRAEDVDAAIRRGTDGRRWTTRTSGTASSWAFDDRAVLAEEVVLLREAMRGLREDLREAGRDLREMEAERDYAERTAGIDR